MTFTAKNAQRFQSMPDKSGAGIMVATDAKPGEDLQLHVSGNGQFQPEGQQDAGVLTAAAAAMEEAVAGKPQDATIVPAADSARRSTPTIRCMTTAP